jgi:acyl-CoA thioester hydrolase
MTQEELKKFKHRHSVTVRSYEIDWQGIVHNSNYLLYFEVARIEYFKAVGIPIDERTINGPIRIVIVRNELDYLSSATFDDTLSIYSRVIAVKNSSLICESLMVNAATNALVAKNVSVLVWTDPVTMKSTTIPNTVRDQIDVFEQGAAEIARPVTIA